ncbi:hypothetical protein GXW82_24460 [Streptacidiphilus sp. 4-A2]|nr:hypothetical protein [Streptacidiphilus sp. 4-A2]
MNPVAASNAASTSAPGTPVAPAVSVIRCSPCCAGWIALVACPTWTLLDGTGAAAAASGSAVGGEG